MKLFNLLVLLCGFTMSKALKIEEITTDAQRCDLGEGPHWDIETQSLYYVDIFGPAIFRFDYESGTIFKATIKDSNEPLGFITPIENRTDEFVVGAGHKLTIIKWDGKSEQATVVKVIDKVDVENEANRINDGKCDPSGRLFFGTIGDESTNLKMNPTGALYNYKNSNSIKLRGSIGIGNGLAWDEKLGKFYYIDSVTRDVKEFDYDSSNGNISNEKQLIDFTKTHDIEFFPDGMTIDANGILFVATWQGSRILIIDPVLKKVKDEILMPTAKVTSLVFGGPALDILYVTTAYHNDKQKIPPAGGLFKITGLATKGLPMSRFKFY